MLDKILDFLKYYLDGVDETVEKIGKYRTTAYALNMLIKNQKFSREELRKELSLYIRRIIHTQEFENLLDKDTIEYQRIVYEVWYLWQIKNDIKNI